MVKNCMLFERGNFDDFNEKIKYIIDNGYDNDILENGYNFVKNERIALTSNSSLLNPHHNSNSKSNSNQTQNLS